MNDLYLCVEKGPVNALFSLNFTVFQFSDYSVKTVRLFNISGNSISKLFCGNVVNASRIEYTNDISLTL